MVNAVEIQSRSLVDTSCQGNYASAALINHISATPVQWEINKYNEVLNPEYKTLVQF